MNRLYNKKIVITEDELPERLNDLFFPVEERPLYWEVEPMFMGRINVLKCEPNFYAVVDINNKKVFSVVTSGYLLITNREAYDFGKVVCHKLFHIENDNDFKVIHAELNTNHAACNIDIRRIIEIYQPLINEGWCAFMRITNSYNKTKRLEYVVGFYNVRDGFGFLDKSISLSAKTAHYMKFGSYQQNILKQIDSKSYNVRKLEAIFFNKIMSLKDIAISKESIVPMFCRVFGLKELVNVADANKERLIIIRMYIEAKAETFTIRYGKNAYALLNVFAEFEYNFGIDNFQFLYSEDKFKLGEWVDDLILKSKQADFTISDYIGKKAIDTAEWLRQQ